MFEPGAKIYDYEYNHTSFTNAKNKGIKITTYTVKECKDGRIHLKDGYGWSVRYEQIGVDFFASKESLVLSAIRANLAEAARLDEWQELQALVGEVSKLTTKLKALQPED